MGNSIYFDQILIETKEGKKIILNPICAYPPKKPHHSEDTSPEEQWYQQFIDELPKLGEEYMKLFIDCKFSPVMFIRRIKENGGIVKYA